MADSQSNGSQDPPGSDSAKNDAPNGAVSAADIQTMKESHEAELRDRDDKITKLSEDVTEGRTAREAAEAKLTELGASLEILTTERDSLKSDVSTSTDRVQVLEEKALGVRREILAERHGVKADTVKDMNESQLEALESVLPSIKQVNVDPKNLDIQGQGSAGGTSAPLSVRDKLAAGLEAEAAGS